MKNELPSDEMEILHEFRDKNKTVDDVLELLEFGRFQYFLFVICGLTFMADAMEVSLLSFIAICAGSSWNLSPSQVAFIAGVVFVGILIGNLFWGVFADKYGRRRGFIYSASFIMVFGLLTGVASNYSTLLLFRALIGFGVGGTPIPYDLLAEFMPKQRRGIYLMYVNYFWTFGSIFVAGFAWILLPSEGWHTLAVVTAVPVTLSLIAAIFLLPESPRWLVEHERYEEAEKVFKSAAVMNNIVLPEFRLIRKTKLLDEKTSVSSATPVSSVIMSSLSGCSELLSPTYIKASVALWTIWIAFGFSYYGIVSFITRLNAKSTDDGDDNSSNTFTCDFEYLNIFVTALAEVGSVSISSVIIQRHSRRTSQGILYALTAFVTLLVSLLYGVSSSTLFALCIFARLVSYASTTVTWISTSEIFPTKTRATGHSIASAMAKLGSLFAPFLVSSNASAPTIGLVLALVNVVALIAVYFLPETKDIQIDTILGGSERNGKNSSDSNKKIQSGIELDSSEEVLNPM